MAPRTAALSLTMRIQGIYAGVMLAEKLLRLSTQNNADFRIFPFFHILCSPMFFKTIRVYGAANEDSNLSVLPREKAVIGFSLPYQNPIREFHSFTFHIPGILFVLSVGKQLGADMPNICFATNPAHAILVADLFKDITSVGAAIFGKAHKS